MELKRLYALSNLKDDVNERLSYLQELTAKAEKMTTSGNGTARGISDRTGEYGSMIADVITQVEELNKICVSEMVFLQKYVNSIDDVLIRRIISLRFIDCRSWRQVARKVGGGNTEDSVKKLAYRYLKNH